VRSAHHPPSADGSQFRRPELEGAMKGGCFLCIVAVIWVRFDNFFFARKNGPRSAKTSRFPEDSLCFGERAECASATTWHWSAAGGRFTAEDAETAEKRRNVKKSKSPNHPRETQVNRRARRGTPVVQCHFQAGSFGKISFS
jgi:hypothetical protein